MEEKRYELLIAQMKRIAYKYNCFIESIAIDISSEIDNIQELDNIFRDSIVSNSGNSFIEMVLAQRNIANDRRKKRNYIILLQNQIIEPYPYRWYYSQTAERAQAKLTMSQLVNEFSSWNPII